MNELIPLINKGFSFEDIKCMFGIDSSTEEIVRVVVLPENKMTKAEAKRAIDDIRSEARDFPEMTLDEINAEINAARNKK